jgi:transposase
MARHGHLAFFVSDVVDALDLSAIFAAYVKTRNRGRAGYQPAMMVKLLVYGYAVGVTSSRKLEKKTTEDVAFRVLSGDQHPDHDSIARTVGSLAEVTSADAGYSSERAVERVFAMGTELLVPPGRQKHGERATARAAVRRRVRRRAHAPQASE